MVKLSYDLNRGYTSRETFQIGFDINYLRIHEDIKFFFDFTINKDYKKTQRDSEYIENFKEFIKNPNSHTLETELKEIIRTLLKEHIKDKDYNFNFQIISDFSKSLESPEYCGIVFSIEVTLKEMTKKFRVYDKLNKTYLNEFELRQNIVDGEYVLSVYSKNKKLQLENYNIENSIQFLDTLFENDIIEVEDEYFVANKDGYSKLGNTLHSYKTLKDFKVVGNIRTHKHLL